MEKISRFHKIFAISALIFTIGALLLAQNSSNQANQPGHNSALSSKFSQPLVTKGLLLPHHLLAKKFIQKIYDENTDASIKTVIVISPNHFDYGQNNIQTTNVDYNNTEAKPPQIIQINQYFIKKISTAIEPAFFPKEHGIYNHIPFITKAFPNAKLVPIIIKKTTPQKQLDQLIQALSTNISDKTIVIASIDFSHYVDEKIALQTDQKIIDYLTNWSKPDDSSSEIPTQVTASLDYLRELAKTDNSASPMDDHGNKTGVAMDSPESLYVFLRLLELHQIHNFSFWKRTSTYTLSGIDNPNLNTTHIFGVFSRE